MKKEEDFPRLEGKEGIDISFEKLRVRKRRWNPFFLVALLFLVVVIAVFLLKLSNKDRESEAVPTVTNEEAWQGAFVDEDTFLRCKMASVSVRANGKRCSGFIFSGDGWIVTVNSVVNDSVKGRIEVVLFDGRRLAVEAFRESRRAGLVLMKVSAQGLCAVDLSFDGRLFEGEEIYSFCSFGDQEGQSLLSGKISHTDTLVEVVDESKKIRSFSLLQIGMLLTEENVGAPLFNENGELIGIGCGLGEGVIGEEKYIINHAFSIKSVKNLLLKMKTGNYFFDELYPFISE